MMSDGCMPERSTEIEEQLGDLPEVFCWTKMGTEAGQELGSILRRKELERQLGGGDFIWGIGNSLIHGLRAARSERPALSVVFSPIRAKPKGIDVHPPSVVIWRRYLDEDGKVRQLPEHVLVTSRGTEELGKRKQAYALFCTSQRSLIARKEATLCFDDLENFGSNKRLGFSQVTAVVRHNKALHSHPRSRCYEIAAVARLFGPLCVRLTDPVEMPREVAREISAIAGSASLPEWRDYVRELRRRETRQLFSVT